MNSDEVVTLKYLVDFLKESGMIFERALDIGSGPTLHQIIPLIPFVKELHISDFLPQNLEEIKKWLRNTSDAHNWDIYIQYVLDLEEKKESIQQRKKTMRERITKLLPVDIYKQFPLGLQTTYPLVTSFFCADSVAKNKKEWKQCMANIFTLIEPSGIIILAALRNADSYQVLEQHFPSPHVDENDFRDLFEKGSFLHKTIDIQVIPIPEYAEEEGFDSVIMAKAMKMS